MSSGTDQRARSFGASRPAHQPRGPQSNQTLNSHGPGERIRGTASQISERYLTLAREASRSDDRVAAEGYYQHADHYFRINNASGESDLAGTPRPLNPATDTINCVATDGEGHTSASNH